MGQPIIELDQVSYKVGYQYLLKDITWKVCQGEHWVVFGLNGSGKTTLLSIIAGFQYFTNGSIKVFGETFSNDNILQIRKNIGFISASFFGKYYHKEEVLYIVLSGKYGTFGLNEDITLEDVRLAKALLTEFRLENKVNKPFNMLSKGEQQNVLIARALFSNPDILILDEPCTGLDVYNRRYLFDAIETLSLNKDLTIIYVTHYVEEIMPLFQNAIMLKNGQVFAKGKTDELFTNIIMQDLLGYPVEIMSETDGTYRMRMQTKSNLANLLKEGVFT